MNEALLLGFALMLVFEGIMPFAAPAAWRATLQKLAGMPDRQLRAIGLGLMIAGTLLALLARN